MGRLILIVILAATTIGCTDSVRIRSEVQETMVPVFFCPAPTPHIRPVLAITTMTNAQKSNPGEIAKHYRVTIEQLLGYSKELELELEKYDSSNTAYEDLRKSMEQKFVDDGVAPKTKNTKD